MVQPNGQVLYGPEWIDFEKEYVKFKLAEDGIYRVNFNELQAAGFPIETVSGSSLQLFYMGREIPIYTSTSGDWSNSDYLDFYGQKNRTELDKHIYQDWESQMLNPEYSLYTDTSAYYLTWTEGGSNLRISNEDNNLSGNLPNAESYYIHHEENVYTSKHYKPTHGGGDNVRYSSFDFSEGFGSSLSKKHTINIAASNIVNTGPNPNLELRTGSNAGLHISILYINDNLVETREYAEHGVNDFDLAFDINDLSSNTKLVIEGTHDNFDRTVVSYTRLNYPRAFKFNNESSFRFDIEGGFSNKYFEIEEFNTTGGNVLFYDITGSKRYVGQLQSDVVRLFVNSSNQERSIYIVNEDSGVKQVSSITPVDFVDLSNVDPNYVILTSKRLGNQNAGTEIQEYIDYRSSDVGGLFTPHIVFVEDLYELYSYGVERHSIAVRNFGQHMFSFWTDPQYIFILGKGREYREMRTPEDLEEAVNAGYFVPTFGSPGSDNLLFSHISTAVPNLPVGRLACKTGTNISDYLDKVRLHESPEGTNFDEDKLWMKRIIHLSGGDADLQSIIRNWLGNMEQIIENNQFAADVITFEKTSSDPLQTATSEQILTLINEGTSMLTFFGHSAVGTFDFSLEDPTKYENYGRYPVISSLGCYSGNIHSSNDFGLSENFVLIKDKAAIAFLAASGTAYATTQYNLGLTIYDLIGGEMYGESLGRILRETLNQNYAPNNIAKVTLTEQFTFHGDPAIKLHPQSGVDYTFDRSKTEINPSIISSSTDSIDFTFEVINIGYYISDSLEIDAELTLPNGTVENIGQLKIAAPSVRESVTIKVPIYEENSVGFNTLNVTLDPQNLIEEAPNPDAELNNKLLTVDGTEGIRFYVSSNDLRPLAPKDFSIVNESEIKLIAGTSNPFFDLQNYIIEIDTTERFDSPLKLRKEGEQQGGLIEWIPEINFINNTVYYWRITPVIPNIDLRWRSSSFLYLQNGEGGWNQSHFYQIKKDIFENIVLPEESRVLEYAGNLKEVRIKTGVHPTVWPEITINNEPYIYLQWGGEVQAGVQMTVIDPISGEPWYNHPPGELGSTVSSSWADPWAVYPFSTNNETNREKAISFLENVPDGFIVIFMTIQKTTTDYKPEEWANDEGTLGRSIYSILESQGAENIRDLEQLGSTPYVFIYKKNDSTYPSQEIFGDPLEETTKTINVQGKWDRGDLSSVLIGPSTEWDKVIWNLDNQDLIQDEVTLNIYGVKNDFSEDLIFPEISQTEIPIDNINASVYSRLRLELVTRDTVSRTPPNLDYWRVLYKCLPEGALNPKTSFSFVGDTLQQGETLQLDIAFDNISPHDMDSIYVKYNIQKSDNSEENIFKRFAALPKDGTVSLELDYDTRNLEGDNILTIEANPFNDQPELFHFNNIGQLPFYIEKDKRNPLLDVTFDGIHILDGDIVSPKPTIRIELRDENQFFILDDITLFEVALESPNGDYTNIPLSSPDLDFIPAQEADNNVAVLIYSPELLDEGVYKLYVQAKDASNNFSGENEYEVNFEVILEETVSNVFNYPNPFSTSTQFIFTLTGDQIPEQFRIDIYTVSGKVVKQITRNELGPLHVGVNRTNYKWDGKDDYGQELANGVYFYRVITKKADGSDYKKFETNTDQFFKDGFGKMVIMR